MVLYFLRNATEHRLLSMQISGDNEWYLYLDVIEKLISFRCRNLISNIFFALYGKFPSISLNLSTVHGDTAHNYKAMMLYLV